MKHERTAELFTSRVDAVLARNGKRDPDDPLTMEDARDLRIVRALASADYSRSSRRLRALRAEIPRAVRLRRAAEAAPGPARRIAMGPLAVASVGLAVVIACAVLPGGPRGLSRRVADFVGVPRSREQGADEKAFLAGMLELTSYHEACERAALTSVAAWRCVAQSE